MYFLALLKDCIENKEIMKLRVSLTCLGVIPGIRISNAKSDEPIGMTGLVVPRQSLGSGLVVSLNLNNNKKLKYNFNKVNT